MSRTAWKSLQPASLAAATLLCGCYAPLSAKLVDRPAERPAAVAAAPMPPPAPLAPALPAGAGALGPAWPESTGWIYRAPPQPPLPQWRIPLRSAHAAPPHPASVHHYTRPVHQPPPQAPRVTRALPEHPLAQPASMRAQAQAARPLAEVPTLIAPVSPPPPSLPDPPAARAPASAAAAAKPASLAPTAPAHPAALSPVHKALPGADTTPY